MTEQFAGMDGIGLFLQVVRPMIQENVRLKLELEQAQVRLEEMARENLGLRNSSHSNS